jgi:hypothetical protein
MLVRSYSWGIIGIGMEHQAVVDEQKQAVAILNGLV